MLPSCILYHIEVECAILHTMTELEHFKLVLGCLILLISEINVDIFHVLSSVFSPHFIWNLRCLQMLNHGVHARDLLELYRGVEASHRR